MGIVLGLVAACCWGVADFLAQQSTRRIGTYRALFWMQMTGLALLTISAGASGELARRAASASWLDWGWAFGLGIVIVMSALALYRSFEIGMLSLVSPIAASYAAITVLLSVLSGETLSLMRGLGLGLTLIGVILATVRPGQAPQAATNQRGGLLWALVAAAGYGGAFWILGFKVEPALGSLVAVWMLRLTAIIVLGSYALLRSVEVRVAGGRNWWLAAIIGVLDTLAYLAHTAGLARDQVALVSVISSLFSTVTVALAWAVLRERPGRNQWAGIALIFAGIILVSR